VHLGPPRHGDSAAARRHRQLRPLTRRTRLSRDRQRRQGQGAASVRFGSLRGLRMEDDRQPVRRAHHDAASGWAPSPS
jgi:hypothetical protein